MAEPNELEMPKRKRNVEKVKRWRKRYPEKQKELSRRYWFNIKSNPKRHEATREYSKHYYKEHREERIRSVKEFWKRNSGKRIYYRLRSNIKNKQRMLKLRFLVFARDNFTCQYCGESIPEVELEIDHKIPIAISKKKRNYQDINTNIEDYITACKECNVGKRDIILEMFKKHL